MAGGSTGGQKQPGGVILGMFKMDCLALFGRNILKMESKEIDDILRTTHSNLLTKVTKFEMETSYSNHMSALKNT